MNLKFFFFLFAISFFVYSFQLLGLRVEKSQWEDLTNALMKIKEQNMKLESLNSKINNSEELEEFLLTLNLEKRNYKDVKKIKIFSKTALK